MLLFYYRTYVSHAFLGALFGVDQGTVSRYVAALEPLLAGIFRVPQRKVELRPDEVRELFFDATERPTRRPKRRQRVAAVSPTAPGKVHDKKVYDRTRVRVPAGARATGDTGYQGTALKTPVKRRRGQRLTRRQRRGNARVSRRRIAVEHAIGKMKIWRIASERYRNPVRRHTLIIKNVAGLHNLMFS